MSVPVMAMLVVAIPLAVLMIITLYRDSKKSGE